MHFDFSFSYRTREEIQDVRKSRDPITSFREKVIQAQLATDEEFKVNFSIFFETLFLIFSFSRPLTMKLKK